MDWAAPGIILAVTPFGEADALAAVFTEAHGVFRGLARGGLSRGKASLWQTGNLIEARWAARLADQLGAFSAELVYPAAALAMDDALMHAVLAASCAVAEGVLPERQAHPGVFRGLLHLIAHLRDGASGVAALAAWELGLLADLGYGLDLSVCALTGAIEDLAFVSPRTGRAVSAAAAGQWRERLLRLPAFLHREGPAVPPASPEDLRDALRLTGHFLGRDAFGARHRAMPPARDRLYERVSLLAGY